MEANTRFAFMRFYYCLRRPGNSTFPCLIEVTIGSKLSGAGKAINKAAKG